MTRLDFAAKLPTFPVSPPSRQTPLAGAPPPDP